MENREECNRIVRNSLKYINDNWLIEALLKAEIFTVSNTFDGDINKIFINLDFDKEDYDSFEHSNNNLVIAKKINKYIDKSISPTNHIDITINEIGFYDKDNEDCYEILKEEILKDKINYKYCIDNFKLDKKSILKHMYIYYNYKYNQLIPNFDVSECKNIRFYDKKDGYNNYKTYNYQIKLLDEYYKSKKRLDNLPNKLTD